jgi:hypothetical protein
MAVSVARFPTMRRTAAVIGVVLAAVVIATAVSAHPARTATVRIDSVGDHGVCAVELGSGQRDCWAYSPEIPESIGFNPGDCYRARWAYDAMVPPHLAATPCPDGG